MSPDLRVLLLAAITSLSLMPLGCSDNETAAPASTQPVATSASESRKARVRFKGINRLQNDLSQALSVPPAELCTELGTTPCTEVHRIALGGVMPYTRGIHEPLALRSVSNAAAVDRLVLSACNRRAELDFAGTPALFADLVAGVSDDAAGKTAHALYNALLRRSETDEERAAIVAFVGEQKQKGTSARDIATLTCYAVGTSVEALFY